MVQHKDPGLDRVFQALSDSTRRDMLMRMAQGEVALSQLSDTYEMSLPAVMKHVRVLEEAGLAVSVKRGRVRQVQVQAKNLRQAAEWIERYERFWNGALDRFADYVRESDSEIS